VNISCNQATMVILRYAGDYWRDGKYGECTTDWKMVAVQGSPCAPTALILKAHIVTTCISMVNKLFLIVLPHGLKNLKIRRRHTFFLYSFYLRYTLFNDVANTSEYKHIAEVPKFLQPASPLKCFMNITPPSTRIN
jgi:hypothetical protein